MIAVFQVGNQETHRVEVVQPFFGNTMTVKVDDVVVARHTAVPLQSFKIQFSCGVDEPHNIEIRINFLTSQYEAYLDGKIFIGCLFPQIVGYNAFGLALLAMLLALFSWFFSILNS